jgi:hypothetical protein
MKQKMTGFYKTCSKTRVYTGTFCKADLTDQPCNKSSCNLKLVLLFLFMVLISRTPVNPDIKS